MTTEKEETIYFTAIWLALEIPIYIKTTKRERDKVFEREDLEKIEEITEEEFLKNVPF